MSIYLSIYLSICMYVCRYVCVCVCVCVPVYLSMYVSVCLSVCLSVSTSVCESGCLSVCPSCSLQVCLSVCLSIFVGRCTIFQTPNRGGGHFLKPFCCRRYIHIPKTAGESFMQDSVNFLPTETMLRGNGERTMEETRQWKYERTKLTVFLRHPWKHVLSQFLECKYDLWGRMVTRRTGFPGKDKETTTAGFSEWLEHFLSDRERVRLPQIRRSEELYAYSDYNCYGERHPPPSHPSRQTCWTNPHQCQDGVLSGPVPVPV